MTYTTLINATTFETERQSNWLVFDIRHDLSKPQWGNEAYLEGHIPQAYFLSLDNDLAAPKNGKNGRHPLPDRLNFGKLMANYGLTKTTQVVVYDDQGGMFAARAWWLLKWLGIESVAVLDGGLQAWQALGKPLSQGQPSQPTPCEPLNLAPLLQPITAASVRQLVEQYAKKYSIIDARSPERYRGDVEPLDAKAGHIPHAKNRFFKNNLDSTGHFKDPQTLKSEWLPYLKTNPSNNILYCGSGATACHNILALEIAGISGCTLYPGSWSEWSSLDDYPIAIGE